MKLQLEQKDTLQQIELLKECNNDAEDAKRKFDLAQEKLIESEKFSKQQSLKIEELTLQVSARLIMFSRHP